MSHIALQQIMVRMLFDPNFTTRVLADPDRLLAGEDLTAEERRWLLRPDPRAWRTDPDRPRRALAVLLQHYPTSLALAIGSIGAIGPIEAYFSSDGFAGVVHNRGSMALAFGDFLAGQVASKTIPDPRVMPLARLEREIARLRLAPDGAASSASTRFVLSPDKALHEAPSGTAALHEAVYLALANTAVRTGGDLAASVLKPVGPLPGNMLAANGAESLLLELVRDEGPRVRFVAGVAEITGELSRLLSFAATPRTIADLIAETMRLGAETEDAEDVVEGLIEEGTLVSAGE